MFIIQYLVVSITLLYLAIFAYIKIKYPFWNNQPVYHRYDFWRALCSEPFFVYKYRPIKTKFCNSTHITTVPYLDVTNETKCQVLDLLRSNYIADDRILLTVQEPDLNTLYAGHMDSPYLSIYTEKIYGSEENLKSFATNVTPDFASFPSLRTGNSLDTGSRTIGSIVSHPVKFYIQGSPQDKVYTELSLYHTDFLCVHRELNPAKKAKILRELFQTHEYSQRLYNPSISGSLFKREIDLLDGIVPLVEYKTYVYYLHDVKFPSLPPHFELVQLSVETIHLLTDFLYVQTHRDLGKGSHLDIISTVNLANYIETIKQNNVYVFCLKQGEFVYAMYFFKDAKMQYEDLEDSVSAKVESNTLQFYGSICNTDTISLFYLGFLHAIHLVIKKYPQNKMLLFENLGDNTVIHRIWRKKNTPVFENKTAYYTFNYVVPRSPLLAEKCLFL